MSSLIRDEAGEGCAAESLFTFQGIKFRVLFPQVSWGKELRKDPTDTTDELEQKLEEEGGGMTWREVGSSKPAVHMCPPAASPSLRPALLPLCVHK